MPGTAFPDPLDNEKSIERAERLFSEAMDALPKHAHHHIMPVNTDMTITGPALHDTQVRAYALLAATRLTPPNPRPSAQDLRIWRNHVLDMAEQYADYIRNGRKAPEGSEAPE